MAVDVSLMNSREVSRSEGGQDARVMQRVVIIAGLSVALLVAMKIGFLQRVLP